MTFLIMMVPTNLKEYVRQAYNTPKKDRGVFEKEMMKLDEKNQHL